MKTLSLDYSPNARQVVRGPFIHPVIQFMRAPTRLYQCLRVAGRNLGLVGSAVILTLLFNNASWAGDLDDVSIQIIGLDQLPNESLQEIPLPAPGGQSIGNMQNDVLLNRPQISGLQNDSVDASQGSPSASPVVGGGSGSGGGGGQ